MEEPAAGMRIEVTEDGPYLVFGDVPLLRLQIVADERGESAAWRETGRVPAEGSYMLCRCGRSRDKPFCDGSHLDGFDGSETAEHDAYFETSVCIEGPGLRLRDARKLCAEARFCDRAGGLWNLIERADEPEVRAVVEQEARDCPSGRYVTCDPDTDRPHEPELEPSIGLVDDPAMGVAGGLWVRGRIPVVCAEGEPYEVRNRATLCRCGASGNKPFCDGSHISEGFSEEG